MFLPLRQKGIYPLLETSDIANKGTLISCAVTMQLICTFVLEKSRLLLDGAHANSLSSLRSLRCAVVQVLNRIQEKLFYHTFQLLLDMIMMIIDFKSLSWS